MPTAAKKPAPADQCQMVDGVCQSAHEHDANGDPVTSGVAMIGAHQLRVLSALAAKHGLRTDNAVHDYLTLTLGREVETRKSLTATEAAIAIRDLDSKVPLAIHEAMNAVMVDVGAVGKDSRNTQQNFNFRGIDAVVNAVAPALHKHNVTVTPRVDDVSYTSVPVGDRGRHATVCRLTVTYTFTAHDGSTLAATVAAEAFDNGDKATPKAMSVAFRTALLQALCLPTDEPDPDSQTYERSGPAQQEDPHRQGVLDPPTPTQAWNVTTEDCLTQIRDAADRLDLTYEQVTAKWRRENGDIPLEDLDFVPAEQLVPLVQAILAEERRRAVPVAP